MVETLAIYPPPHTRPVITEKERTDRPLLEMLVQILDDSHVASTTYYHKLIKEF